MKRKFFVAIILLLFSIVGCSKTQTYADLLSITNIETGVTVALGDEMASVDEKLGEPQYYPDASAYLYGDINSPSGWFSAYYDHGNICCLIIGPDENSKWEVSNGIRLGIKTAEISEVVEATAQKYENSERNFSVYFLNEKFQIVSEADAAKFSVMFALSSDDLVDSVLISTTEYLSAKMELSNIE